MKKKAISILLILSFICTAVPYAAAADLTEPTEATVAETQAAETSPTDAQPTEEPTEAAPVRASEKAQTCATEAPIEAPAKVFPVISEVAPSLNGVTVKWKAFTGASKYIVYAKKGAAKSWSKLATVSALSYEHRLTPNNTQYTYSVRAADQNGKALGDFNDKGYAFSCLPTPTLKKLENTASGQKLTWNSVGTNCIYRVFFKKNGSWSMIADTDKTSYTYTGAANQRAYTYTVRCVNSRKKPLSYFDRTGLSATFYAAPKFTKFVAVSNGISVQWNAVKGADRYRLYVKNNGRWKTICNTDQTVYAHLNLKTNTTYTYAVRTLNKKGELLSSYYTTDNSFRLLNSQRITAAEYRDNKYVVRWDALKGAARYRVFRRELDGAWKPIAYSKTNSYSDATAKKTGVYCYAARALNAASEYMTAFTDSGRYYRMGVCIIGPSDSKTPGTNPRYTCPVSETELRQQVAMIANGWLGAEEGDAVHADILAFYNTHYPVAVDYKMSTHDAWCAAFTSACWIRAGIADFTGTECGCGRFIDVAKENEIWIESDNYTPKVGDAILYNWDDSGVGECTRGADHVGIVTSVSGKDFVVTEGNTGYGYCGTHDRVVNQQYIRGYIAPNYAQIAQYLTLKAKYL